MDITISVEILISKRKERDLLIRDYEFEYLLKNVYVTRKILVLDIFGL